MIEVKTSQERLSDSLRFFAQKFPNIKKIQLVSNLNKEKTFPSGIEIRKAASWLSRLPF